MNTYTVKLIQKGLTLFTNFDTEVRMIVSDLLENGRLPPAPKNV